MIDRRTLLRAGMIGTFGFVVGGRPTLLSPSEARAQGAEFQILTADDAKVLDVIGDGLLPGAAKAGLSHYLDAQLARPPDDSFLMIRYLDVAPPWDQFYKGLATAFRIAADRQWGQAIPELGSDEIAELIAGMAAGKIDRWEGPPQSLAYFVLRSDAVDVTYGTVDGFRRLGVPYLAHIEPESAW